MVDVVRQLDPESVRANLDEVKREIAEACSRSGRSADDVRIVAAVKYVAADQIPVLLEAGVEIAGENRAQDLAVKSDLVPDLTWHFIGHIQSRKVRDIAPRAHLIHSVCTDSVLAQLAKHAPGAEILVEVNVAGEEAKSGVLPQELDSFLARCADVAGAPVKGLMTMPPLAASPEGSRRWFAQLAQMASDRGLPELSMGTTQDFAVAVEEGATMVRIGSRLFRPLQG